MDAPKLPKDSEKQLVCIGLASTTTTLDAGIVTIDNWVQEV